MWIDFNLCFFVQIGFVSIRAFFVCIDCDMKIWFSICFSSLYVKSRFCFIDFLIGFDFWDF